MTRSQLWSHRCLFWFTCSAIRLRAHLICGRGELLLLGREGFTAACSSLRISETSTSKASSGAHAGAWSAANTFACWSGLGPGWKKGRLSVPLSGSSRRSTPSYPQNRLCHSTAAPSSEWLPGPLRLSWQFIFIGYCATFCLGLTLSGAQSFRWCCCAFWHSENQGWMIAAGSTPSFRHASDSGPSFYPAGCPEHSTPAAAGGWACPSNFGACHPRGVYLPGFMSSSSSWPGILCFRSRDCPGAYMDGCSAWLIWHSLSPAPAFAAQRDSFALPGDLCSVAWICLVFPRAFMAPVVRGSQSSWRSPCGASRCCPRAPIRAAASLLPVSPRHSAEWRCCLPGSVSSSSVSAFAASVSFFLFSLPDSPATLPGTIRAGSYAQARAASAICSGSADR